MRAFPRRLLAGLVLLALLGACGDREAAVRAKLSQWLVLGETQLFVRRLQCGVGIFRLGSDRITSDVDMARSEEEAMLLLRIGRPFALSFPGRSISEISELMQMHDFSTGMRIINSGVAARECLDPADLGRYATALRRPGGVVIFEPASNSLVTIDPGAGLAFYVRGAL